MSQRLTTQEEIKRAVDDMDFLAGGFWDEEYPPINEAIQKEFVPLDSDVRGEEGQNSKEWYEVLDDFGSRRLYQRQHMRRPTKSISGPGLSSLCRRTARLLQLSSRTLSIVS